MAFRLYDYQEEMRVRLCEGFLTHGALMCQMPTGTGKTHVLAAVVASVAGPGDEVWVVAHRRELVDQVRRTWDTLYREHTDAPAVRVLSIQWLSRHWDDVASCSPKMIVIDEAHHAVAESYRELFRRYPGAKKLGMTATPCRLDGKGFTDLFDALLSSRSLPQFIADGHLSLFDYHCVPDNSKVRRLLAAVTRRSANGDYPPKELDHILNNPRNIAHLHASLQRYAPGRKGIVYAISIDHARNIAHYYSSKGLRCCTIDTRTPAKEREARIGAFRRGDIDVMVNVDIFSEGFDCPDVGFIQLARPTLSLALYLQQIGRGLRNAKGKDYCTILDCVGLAKTFGLPIREYDWQATFRGAPTPPGPGRADRRQLLRHLGYPGPIEDEPLERIVDHRSVVTTITEKPQFSVHTDPRSGLITLKTKDSHPLPLKISRVIALQGPFAVVETAHTTVAIVHADGYIQHLRNAADVTLQPNAILKMTVDAKPLYRDIYGPSCFSTSPALLRIGDVELLHADGLYTPRTRLNFRFKPSGSITDSCWKGYYLEIPGVSGRLRLRYDCGGTLVSDIDITGNIILLPADHTTIYRKVADAPGGGIIISDLRANHYLLTPDGTRRPIGRPSAPDTTLLPSGFDNAHRFYSEMQSLQGRPASEWHPTR